MARLRKPSESKTSDYGQGLVISGPPLSEVWKPSQPLSQEVTKAIYDTLQQKMTVKVASMKIFDGYGRGGLIPEAELPEYLDQLQQEARRVKSDKIDPKLDTVFQDKLSVARANVGEMPQVSEPSRMLRAAYYGLLEAAENKTQKALDKAVYVAIQEKTRFKAYVIAHTEYSHARLLGFMKMVRQDDTITSIKWNRNRDQSGIDICYLYANADFYGLGPGLFPCDKYPSQPAHLLCMCYASTVSEYEAAQPRQFDASAGDRFIKKLSSADRKTLLGIDGVEAWEKGGDWQTLVPGWQGHKTL